MPVAGEDRYGHWDRDPEPRIDLDPVSMAALDDVWARYRDAAATRQAASPGTA
jgi:non-haem Fe2+, alpha-ketoglutarate-dependent halogenase